MQAGVGGSHAAVVECYPKEVALVEGQSLLVADFLEMGQWGERGLAKELGLFPQERVAAAHLEEEASQVSCELSQNEPT